MAGIIIKFNSRWAMRHYGACVDTMQGEVRERTEKAIFFKGNGYFDGSSDCGACGRALTHPVSRRIGIGPICAGEIGMSRYDVEPKTLDELRAQWARFTSFQGWIPVKWISVIDGELPEAPSAPESATPARKITARSATVLNVLFDYDASVVSAVKALAGRKFVDEYPKKYWTVPVSYAGSSNVDAIEEFADQYEFELSEQARQMLVDARVAAEAQAEQKAEALVASRAADAEIEVAGLGGELRPFQKAGVAYALKSKRCFIADEMGLGKTVQALATVHAASAFPALIVCPASLKLNWRNEIFRWLPYLESLQIAVITGKPLKKDLDSLRSLVTLNAQIRREGLKQSKDINGSIDVPTILDFSTEAGSINGIAHINKATPPAQPIDERFMGIIDDYLPGSMRLARRDDTTFAIDDPSHISQIDGLLGDNDRVGGPMSSHIGDIVRPEQMPDSHAVNSESGCYIDPSSTFGKHVCSQGEIGLSDSSASPDLDSRRGLEGQLQSLKPVDELASGDTDLRSGLTLRGVSSLQALRDAFQENIKRYVVTQENLQFVIINYDILQAWSPILQVFGFKAIIFDESHALKNHAAKRTEAAAALAKGAEYRICLTGTPLLNRPAELLSQLGILGRLNDLGGFWPFAKRYCQAFKSRWGWDFSGAAHLDELNTKMRETCFIRRNKVDVLTELPAKQRVNVAIEIDNRREYNKAEADLVGWLKSRAAEDKAFLESIKALTADEQKAAKVARADSAGRKAEAAEQLVRIEVLKQLAVKGKMAAVKEWVESFLETGEKLILFASHIEAQKTLLETFAAYNPAHVFGEDSAETRQANVDRFQNDPACKLIVCSLVAAGVGITLTAASNVAFVELGWTPALHDQAEDRAHRIGQTDQVTAWYLLAANTIDEQIAELIEAKRVVVNAATDGEKVKRQPGILSALVGRLTGTEIEECEVDYESYISQSV